MTGSPSFTVVDSVPFTVVEFVPFTGVEPDPFTGVDSVPFTGVESVPFTGVGLDPAYRSFYRVIGYRWPSLQPDDFRYRVTTAVSIVGVDGSSVDLWPCYLPVGRFAVDVERILAGDTPETEIDSLTF